MAFLATAKTSAVPEKSRIWTDAWLDGKTSRSILSGEAEKTINFHFS